MPQQCGRVAATARPVIGGSPSAAYPMGRKQAAARGRKFGDNRRGLRAILRKPNFNYFKLKCFT
eukprot:765270-Hanusia_phi.AAC.1